MADVTREDAEKLVDAAFAARRHTQTVEREGNGPELNAAIKAEHAAYEDLITALTRPAPQPSDDDTTGESDTGNPEADRVINRLNSSDPDFDDCLAAVVLIRKLVVEHKGPEGFATWKDAALAARLAASRVPEGWQLVPKEPTEEMLDAAHDTGCTSGEGTIDDWIEGTPREVWDAMLAAAPAPEVKK